MKRFLIVAAAALALVSCDKETQGTDPSGKKDPTGKKQEIVITCGQSGTKVSGEGDTDGKITFKWQSGDYLYVTEKDHSPEYFVLEGGSGTTSGKFRGEVSESAGSETEFKVQWPDATPVLTSQTYVAGGIEGEKMLATATITGVNTLKAGFALAPQSAVVRLDVKGDATIKTIVLKVGTSDTYTLNCTSVALTDASATPFYFVAKPTETSQTVSIQLTDSGDIDLGTFTSVSAVKKLQAGVTLKLGELTIYKDGTFSSEDFNGENWYTHGSDDVNAGDFGGENW